MKRSAWRKLIRKPPPALARHLRASSPLSLGPALEPDRRKRKLPAGASLEEYIEDFVSWMIAGGFAPEEAKRQAEFVREYHRQTGKNFLTLTPAEQFAFIVECDRQRDELAGQEAEALADVDPDEPEH
jgi:hypothetical protein